MLADVCSSARGGRSSAAITGTPFFSCSTRLLIPFRTGIDDRSAMTQGEQNTVGTASDASQRFVKRNRRSCREQPHFVLGAKSTATGEAPAARSGAAPFAPPAAPLYKSHERGTSVQEPCDCQTSILVC